MRLEEALRKAIRQFGVSVLREKRLLFILSDLRAFEEYPAARQVLAAIVSDGAGKELCRLFLDDDREGCISYARSLGKSLSEESRFRRDLALYAADSILFALGLTKSVTEPSDHGFDPLEHGSGGGRAGAGWQKAAGGDRGRTEGSAGGGAGEAAGEGAGGMPGQEAKETRSRSPEAPGGSGGTPRSASGKRPSKVMKWAAAALLLAGGFALGLIAAGTLHDNEQADASLTVGSSEAVKDAGHTPGAHGNGKDSHDARGDGEAYAGAQEGYRKADEKGDPGAEYALGLMYEFGQGVSRDYGEALRWYRLAADQGYPRAEYRTGLMYEYGTGVRCDDEEALIWYRKAAAHGNREAESAVGRLERLVSAQGGGSGAGDAPCAGREDYLTLPQMEK